jgi:acetyltransferase-like isoleucine patch superfamily enzyme
MERLPYVTGAGRIVIGVGVRLSGKSGIGFGRCGGIRPSLLIGDETFIGHDCGFTIASTITIGKRCLIAGGVSIRDYDGHPVDAEARRRGMPCGAEAVKPVVIGDDVWIGAGAIVLKGVRIGDRSIIGAGAVVSREVPPDSVVAGNPARVVRSLMTGAAEGERMAA